MFRSHHQALGIATPRTQGIHNMRRQASAEAARLARSSTAQRFWESPFVQRGHRNSVVTRAMINAAGTATLPYLTNRLYDWYTKPKTQPVRQYLRPKALKGKPRMYTLAHVPQNNYNYNPYQKGYRYNPRRRNIYNRKPFRSNARPYKRSSPPRRRNYRPRQPRYKYKYKYKRRRY